MRSKWQGKAWRQSKERWHEAQSSQEVWKSASSDAKWTEVTKEMNYLNKVSHEKQTTWNESLKETSKRESDLTKTIECALDEKEE